MTKLKHWGMIFTAAATLLTGCSSDDMLQTNKGEGLLKISLGVDTSVKSASKNRSRTELEDVTIDNLSLSLTSADGSYSKSWESIADFLEKAQNGAVALPIGQYTLEAKYGDADNEGYESPYVYGTTEVKIRENETIDASLTAQLANSRFTIGYTDALKKYLTDYSAEVQTPGGSTITYPADETRPVYVKSGLVSIYVNATKPNGKSVRLHAADVTTEAQNHYEITIDMNDGEVGEGQLVVTFDDNLQTEEYIVDLSDEFMNKPAPSVDINGESEFTASIVSGAGSLQDLRFNIMAPGKIAKAYLTTSNHLTVDPNWPESTELVALDAANQAKMTEMGMKTRGLWKNPDVFATVDVQGSIEKVYLTAGEESASIRYNLTVEDACGKSSQTATLIVNVEKEKVTLENPGLLFEGLTSLDFEMTYNGGHPENRISIQYKNNRGTWSKLTDVTFAEIAGESGRYTVAVNGISDSGDVLLRAISDTGVLSNELKASHVKSDPKDCTVSVIDTRATNALMDIKMGDVSLAKFATVFISTDGENYTKATHSLTADNQLNITNLTAGTTYSVKISLTNDVDNATNPVSFTTESALQLPNGSMETWYTVAGKSNNWWIEYPGENENAVWTTQNLTTTSEGGSNTSALSSNRDGCAYNAFSGTRVTTDAVSGNAAIIETVGWGKGNAAAGNISGCKKITVGELSLTDYAFASRPASLAFYYKYTPKNSADYGYAEIKVIDASANVIASATKNLSAASDYTLVTLPLTYATIHKAAKISVMFKSSGNAACQSISTANLSMPSFGNTSNGRYTGSSLYIDEITLNY